MATLGLCMITKDESDCLADALASVRDHVDEIVVLDTGSTDNTVQIAKQFHAKVHKFKWRDDFSAARNESLRYVTTDWILILDADEVIADKDMQRIKRHVNMKKHKESLVGMTLLQRNYTNDTSVADWKASDKYEECKTHNGFFVSPIVRLFKRHPEIQFRFKVHEDIGRSIIENGGEILESTIPIHHYGYCKESHKVKAKSDKYLELGLAQLKKTPNHPKPYFELGKVFNNRSEFDRAIKCFTKVISLNPRFPKAYATLGDTYSRKGDLANAAKYYVKALELKPDEENSLNNLGVIFLKTKQYQQAAGCFDKALKVNPSSAKAFNNMAAALMKLNMFHEALEVLKEAHKKTKLKKFKEEHDNLKSALDKKIEDIKKDFTKKPGDIALANSLSEMFYRLKRFDDARNVLEQTLNKHRNDKSPESVNLFFNFSNCLVALKEYHLAMKVLDDAKRLDPAAVGFIKTRQKEIKALATSKK